MHLQFSTQNMCTCSIASFRLAAVGADILHGRRPGLARDQREVFEPPQSALYGPLHQVVPFDFRRRRARTVPPLRRAGAIRCETGVSSSPS